VLRIVADLGNSRMKWGRLGIDGQVERVLALPPDDPSAWAAAWSDWHAGGSHPSSSSWAIGSVNPPLAERLRSFLEARGVVAATWYRSAAEVAVAQALSHPETAGADRALAVAAAVGGRPAGRPGMVVMCGTAVTIERIAADGVWQGGAIAAGLGLTARALHILTAQLPLVAPREAPAPWGSATTQALEAGVFWGVVGAIRELLTRQAEGFGETPWLVWSGGYSETLSRAVAWPDARVVPDLVLHGLAHVAFGGGPLIGLT
jgi:type III pantothenate kinase